MHPDDYKAIIISLGFVFGVVFGAYTGTVAQKKGYSGGAWFVGGLFFNFIALIAAAGLPMKKPPSN